MKLNFEYNFNFDKKRKSAKNQTKIISENGFLFSFRTHEHFYLWKYQNHEKFIRIIFCTL